MFLIKCPRCGHSMKYNPLCSGQELAGRKKACVYCGYSIPASNHIIKRF